MRAQKRRGSTWVEKCWSDWVVDDFADAHEQEHGYGQRQADKGPHDSEGTAAHSAGREDSQGRPEAAHQRWCGKGRG